MVMLEGVCAEFVPAQPLKLEQWFRQRDQRLADKAAAQKEAAAQKGYVEKGNKDEVFRYHISKVVEEDDSLMEDPVLTNEDLVLGIRPEFVQIDPNGALEGEIYGAMPTGMESTIKIRVGNFLLTGVVFGNTLFKLGEKIRLNFSGSEIMLFDRSSGERITSGSLKLL